MPNLRKFMSASLLLLTTYSFSFIKDHGTTLVVQAEHSCVWGEGGGQTLEQNDLWPW